MAHTRAITAEVCHKPCPATSSDSMSVALASPATSATVSIAPSMAIWRRWMVLASRAERARRMAALAETGRAMMPSTECSASDSMSRSIQPGPTTWAGHPQTPQARPTASPTPACDH
ncbi:MAG: hypothetical protein ACRDX8_08630 [Acidimicrobiales bacterium]